MRPDLFKKHKTVSVRLGKSVHAEFQKMLYDRGLPMWRVFSEFAKLVIEGDTAATKMLDNIALKVIRGQIDANVRKAKQKIDVLDHDAIYRLIEENEEDCIEKE